MNNGMSAMGGNNSGPRPNFYDRRNRNPHDVYRKLGGVLGPQDVTGVLNDIDWKKLNMPKFRKNFYKVLFFVFLRRF